MRRTSRAAREFAVDGAFVGQSLEAFFGEGDLRFVAIRCDVAAQRVCGGEQAKRRTEPFEAPRFPRLFATHFGFFQQAGKRRRVCQIRRRHRHFLDGPNEGRRGFGGGHRNFSCAQNARLQNHFPIYLTAISRGFHLRKFLSRGVKSVWRASRSGAFSLDSGRGQRALAQQVQFRMTSDEIWLTGTGVVCPLGLDTDTFWRRLVVGESGIGPLSKIPTSGLRNARGGQINGFDAGEWVEDGDCDEASAFAFVAATQAAQGAGLSDDERARCGLALGTNFGGAASWELVCELARDGERDPETFTQFLPDHAATFLAGQWNNSGPRATISNACSSGAHAIGLAANWLRLGRCDIAVAGGFDGLGLSTLAGLSILRTISPDEIRPFDARRNGTIFGEGAAFVVLETASHARKRGAAPLAKLCGWSVGANAHHLTAPDKGGAGLAFVMERALDDAKWNADSVEYINAHGTGTQLNDLAETQAIQTVFGPHPNDLAISSIKAATSHTMGAAGALEAIATALALSEGTLPPTLNLENPDPELPLDYIPLVSREKQIKRALSNSSGIGGNNACLALEKV